MEETQTNTQFAQPVQAQSPPAIPIQWPGAFGVYEYSKNTVKFNLNPLLLFAVGGFVIAFVPEILSASGSEVSGLISIVVNVFGFILQIAATITVLRAVKRESISASDALSQSVGYLVKYFFLVVLVGLAAVASLLLFVIPFFIVLPRLLLAPYFLIDQNIGIGDALSKSWEQSKGHATKVWGILAVSILMSIACIVLVGFYFLFMYTAAFAILYFFVTTGSRHQATQTSSPSPKPLTQ